MKVHLYWKLDFDLTMCGVPYFRVAATKTTKRPEAVTCKKCINKMLKYRNLFRRVKI